MGFFGKKNNKEVIDFTELQRRGVIREQSVKNEPDVVDLSSISGSSVNSESSSNPAGDFLSSLAGVGASEGANFGSSVTDSLRDARARNVNPQINEIKIKVEDNEYKLKDLSEKILELERKLREIQG